MPSDIFKDLKNTWVANKKLNITRHKEEKSERKDSDAGDKPIRRKPKLNKNKNKKNKKG